MFISAPIMIFRVWSFTLFKTIQKLERDVLTQLTTFPINGQCKYQQYDPSIFFRWMISLAKSLMSLMWRALKLVMTLSPCQKMQCLILMQLNRLIHGKAQTFAQALLVILPTNVQSGTNFVETSLWAYMSSSFGWWALTSSSYLTLYVQRCQRSKLDQFLLRVSEMVWVWFFMCCFEGLTDSRE